ncbi:MAG: HAD family hydrolase [Candidatus Woesebacteria bacterium]|jgi:FMN phosphatase YigB (HAD superfamily)
MRIKAIFFDLDNTLVNTANISQAAYKKAIDFLAQKLSFDEEIIFKQWRVTVKKLKFSKNPKERSFEYSLAQTLGKLNLDKSFIPDAVRILEDEVAAKLSLTKGSRRFLEQDLSVLKILITEGSQRLTDLKLNKFNLKDRFDLIFNSDEMKVMKPSIKYYERAWKKFKLKAEECLYVGDNWEKDCQIGQEQGGIGVLFSKKSKKANYCIHDMMQLNNFL